MGKKTLITCNQLGWQPMLDKIEVGEELRLRFPNRVAARVRKALKLYKGNPNNQGKRFSTHKVLIIKRHE